MATEQDKTTATATAGSPVAVMVPRGFTDAATGTEISGGQQYVDAGTAARWEAEGRATVLVAPDPVVPAAPTEPTEHVAAEPAVKLPEITPGLWNGRPPHAADFEYQLNAAREKAEKQAEKQAQGGAAPSAAETTAAESAPTDATKPTAPAVAPNAPGAPGAPGASSVPTAPTVAAQGGAKERK